MATLRSIPAGSPTADEYAAVQENIRLSQRPESGLPSRPEQAHLTTKAPTFTVLPLPDFDQSSSTGGERSSRGDSSIHSFASHDAIEVSANLQDDIESAARRSAESTERDRRFDHLLRDQQALRTDINGSQKTNLTTKIPDDDNERPLNADIPPVPSRPVLPFADGPPQAPDLRVPRLNGPSTRFPFRKPEVVEDVDTEDSIQVIARQIESPYVPTSGPEEGVDIETSQEQSTRVDITSRPIATPREIQRGKRLWSITKFTFMASQVGVNFLFIFSTWWWSQYYYIYLPFITITVALNCIMVFSVIFHGLFRLIKPEKKTVPPTPESLVFLLPCYNETLEECSRSLNSLADQENIDAHPRAVLIVVDGRVRSKGMQKTCADYLLDDILIERSSRRQITNAYSAWDTHPMDVTLQEGTYRGLPYFCVVKHRNQGKRDSLILARSFLYKFNMRNTRPSTIMSRELFGELSRFLETDSKIDQVTHLIGMDADTIFARDCVSEILPESRYAHTAGVCGYVCVDFSNHGNWSIWSLYQSAEYTISQGLRRLHQSVATHKVSCLPGCCQLLRICEETCGDQVLLELFGYYPYPTDGMLKQIRATASEDRNHVCLMLSARSKVQTRQALRAKAYTDVPHSWTVFLSQRRRWTLGATSNDLYLVTAQGINFFERILATANVVTWYLNPFILASIASFIIACTFVEYWIVLSFASVMILPLIYYICIAIWLPRTARERIQYLLGLACYVFLGPFLNIAVLCYALWNMDNFGWGKTRKIVQEPETQTEQTSDSDTTEKVSRRRESLITQADPTRHEWDEEARVGAPSPGIHRPSAY